MQTCCVRALLSEQDKNDLTASFLFLLGPSLAPLKHFWVPSGQLNFCVWGQVEVAFGSACCLSESNITRGLAWFQVFPSALHCSVVKFRSDFLALGKTIECLSEPSQGLCSDLQLPGFDWVTSLALPSQPIPFCLVCRVRSCVVILGLRREETPSFCPQPGVRGLQRLWPRLGVACLSRASSSCLSGKGKNANPKQPRPPSLFLSQTGDLFSTWHSPARNFQLF